MYLHQYTKIYWSKNGEDFPPENYISDMYGVNAAEFSYDASQDEWFLTQTELLDKKVLLNEGTAQYYSIKKFYWNYPLIDER